MPANLYKSCTDASSANVGSLKPLPGSPTETVNCQAAPVIYQVSEYPDTPALNAAFRRLVSPLLLGNTHSSCHAQHGGWSGVGVWRHVAVAPGAPRHLGGSRACYAQSIANSSGMNWVIIWSHVRANEQGVPPQCDHRDVLVVAEQKNTGIPAGLQSFFRQYQKPIGFLGGAAPTQSAQAILNAHCPA
jgi:hypothetical protein